MPAKVELLAPAGKWPVLEEVVRAGADAVYIGGKRFNMRLLRPDFNFSDQELRDAVKFCREHGVRLYVTVNNLYYEDELDPLRDYIAFLAGIGVDALIVQDLAVAELASSLGTRLPLHASVNMGVANAPTARVLEELGFTRVILSKNLSLKEIKELSGQTRLGIEYFVHGDMCIAHAGQCCMSSFIFGKSGNRGRCRKPCRWAYRLEGEKLRDFEGYHYFLAHKDLCLVNQLADLAESGVSSFKIEGRMRETEYVAFLVSVYRRALDRYLSGEVDEEAGEKDQRELYSRRVRDFSLGSIYSVPGKDDIGFSGEREPAFPTGPVRVKTWDEETFEPVVPGKRVEMELSVSVGGFSALTGVLDQRIDTLIIPGTIFHSRRDGFASTSEISSALLQAAGAGVRTMLELPRAVTQRHLSQAEKILNLEGLEKAEGVIAHDLGSLVLARDRGYRVWAGHGMNLSNALALQSVSRLGAVGAQPGLELGLGKLTDMAAGTPVPLEVMVHGPMAGMISDYCPARAVSQTGKSCPASCRRGNYALVDELEQEYPLAFDLNCRAYVYYPLDLCLFPALPRLGEAGIQAVRIEGTDYQPGLLKELIGIYRSALDEISRGEWTPGPKTGRLQEMFSGRLGMAPPS